MKLAPIVVYVYHRHEKLKRCIEALKANPLAPQSDLFIVSDGPRPKDVAAVEQVREVCRQVTGFRAVNLILRPVNLGITDSVSSAEVQVVGDYGRVISLEDDNEVSQNFLQFINEGLDYYEQDRRIYSVGGYRAPFPLPAGYTKDHWFGPWHNPWTYGTWKDRRLALDIRRNDFSSTFDSARRRGQLRRLGRFMYDSAWLDWKGIAHALDARVCMHMFERDMVSVFPVVSKVRNTGHDGSGLHAKKSERFDVEHDSGRDAVFHFEPFDGLNARVVEAYRLFMDRGHVGTLVRDLGIKRMRYQVAAALKR